MLMIKLIFSLFFVPITVFAADFSWGGINCGIGSGDEPDGDYQSCSGSGTMVCSQKINFSSTTYTPYTVQEWCKVCTAAAANIGSSGRCETFLGSLGIKPQSGSCTSDAREAIKACQKRFKKLGNPNNLCASVEAIGENGQGGEFGRQKRLCIPPNLEAHACNFVTDEDEPAPKPSSECDAGYFKFSQECYEYHCQKRTADKIAVGEYNKIAVGEY